MKKIILTLLFLYATTFAFSQSSREKFSGHIVTPAEREKLVAAEQICEVIPGCPAHWKNIINIESVTIGGYSAGKKISAETSGEMLSTEQKNILASVDPGTEITIEIWFRWKDNLSAKNDYGAIQKMNEFRLAVLPEIEAEYPGGPEKISQYLEDSLYSKLDSALDYRKIRGAEGFFTIDETGAITEAHLFRSSMNSDVDQIYLDALNRMPKWKPAQNADGIKVKQVFSFFLGNPHKGKLAAGERGRSGC